MGILTILVPTALAVGTYTGARWASGEQTDKEYDQLVKRLNDSGYKDVPVKQIMADMHTRGVLDTDEYKKAVKIMDQLDKNYSDNASGWNNFWQHGRNQLFTTNPQARTLLKKIGENLDGYLPYDVKNIVDDVKAGYAAGRPTLPGVSAPTYFDTDFEPYQRDIKPVKWWSNQELADLHNLNYDLSNYYDLIKAGTSAAVEAGKYRSEQANNATLQNNTEEVASYLDSIRNNRAESLAKGATLGAQAANDVLNTVNSLKGFSDQQTKTAQQRFDLVDELLQEDAAAKITANQYFHNLARNLYKDSMTLYENDTDRYGQDWATNAEFYSADRNLQGINAKLNGDMAGQYAISSAQAAQAARGVNDDFDEYLWLLDRFNAANKGNQYKAILDMNDYVQGQYTGAPSQYDYLKNKYYT